MGQPELRARAVFEKPVESSNKLLQLIRLSNQSGRDDAFRPPIGTQPIVGTILTPSLPVTGRI
jgi:hypothetical protein